MDQASSLKHTPSEKWAFDESVTQVFDDMLDRSIPQHRVMRAAVTDVASKFARPGSLVVDLGCSRGEALAGLIEVHGAQLKYLGLEIAKPMLESSQVRFRALIDAGIVEIVEWDLRRGLPPYRRASVVLSVLTLMFVPIEYRQQLLRQIYEMIEPGGVFVLVEKLLGANAEIDALLVERYYAMKAANGYSGEEIARKRLSLEGVLVPARAEWNRDMLLAAGFSATDCFWRWMNFGGWIAIK